jgi:hypothetical protein
MHVGITVNKGTEEAREFTQRARSFLSATLGAVVADLFALREVLFFENGVVSLNLPVSQHVIGSRATRTTHPKVIDGLNRLFTLISEAPFASSTRISGGRRPKSSSRSRRSASPKRSQRRSAAPASGKRLS